MQRLLRAVPWSALALAWGLPSVAFAQDAHDCPPGQIWDHAACVPDPMLAEPEPSAASSAPESPPSLRIDTAGEHDHFDVTVTLPGGGTQHCATDVTRAAPCVLDGLAAGHAQVVVRGAGSFTQDVELAPGRQRVTLTHTPAANGVLPGALVVVASVLLGGGAAWMFAVCVEHASCGDEVVTGVAIPMALASGAGLILGGGMLFWHRPEQNGAQVAPDADATAANVVHAPTPSLAFGVTPVANGGGLFAFGVTF